MQTISRDFLQGHLHSLQSRVGQQSVQGMVLDFGTFDSAKHNCSSSHRITERQCALLGFSCSFRGNLVSEHQACIAVLT